MSDVVGESHLCECFNLALPDLADEPPSFHNAGFVVRSLQPKSSRKEHGTVQVGCKAAENIH